MKMKGGGFMENLFKFPLKQHVGVDSNPVVKKNDSVKRGQLIATMPEGMLGANIYSSITGTVVEVSEMQICIKPDKTQSDSYMKLHSKKPLDLIREAGIVGLGGAGFPTYAKLQKPFGKNSGVVIVNAAECEPILSHNIDSIEHHAQQLIRGLDIVMDIVKADKGIIAIKSVHPEVIHKLEEVINNSRIHIHKLEDMYPMGEERAIVREVLDRLLDITELPFAADTVVINAETICRIQEAVDEKKPLIDKDITVAGKLKNGLIHIFHDVPLGISVGDIFEKAGGLADEYGELIMGGPFTGKRTSLDAPVIKTTGGLIAAEEFWKGPDKLGLLVCACGGNKERLEEIAASMGSEVVGVEYCKQAHEMKNGSLKCENPGRCPGQVQKVMALKKDGAQALLISNCTDCSNTVMSCAPQLKLPVYHCTDGALRAVNHKLIRKIK